MKEFGLRNSAFGCDTFGLKGLNSVYWNLTEAELYEHAIRKGEAQIAAGGALCAETGAHTGRSPKDKFVVRDAKTENTIWWDNSGAMSQSTSTLFCRTCWHMLKAWTCMYRTFMEGPTQRVS